MDFTGLCVLSYATVACVWTLLDAFHGQPRVVATERPSALPQERR